MIRSYLKTALRNLWRNKNFTIINVAGLAVGITVCMVIFLIVQFELSFEKFHSNKDRIYRVISARQNADGVRRSAGVPYPLPTTLHNDFPSLISSAVYQDRGNQISVLDDKSGQPIKKFKEDEGFFFAEPSFFQMFNFPLLGGEYQSLKDPNTALLTKETAEKYFGDWRLAIGKTIRKNNDDLLKVVGVLASIPKNTDFQIRVVVSYSTEKDFTKSNDWISVASNHGEYILLPEGMAPGTMSSRLNELQKKYNKDEDTRKREGNTLSVQSLNEVHYDTEIGNFLDKTISKNLINSMWLMAGFILLIACVNFINLATAQSFNRAKEVAVRKVLGGDRRQIRLQFFTETSLITLASVILAVLLTALSTPLIDTILDLPLVFSLSANPGIILFLLITAIVIIFLAGFYPAIVLSRFNPVTALKSKIVMGRSKGISLRRALVVFQFVIAQGLIIGTLIIVKQMDLFKNQSMGFDKEAIVNVSLPDDSVSRTKSDNLKTRLLGIPGIRDVSFSFASPADDGNWSSNFKFNHADKETDWSTNLKWADADYLKTYGITLVAGRNLKPSDTAREFLVNETLLKRLGITNPQDALNKEIDLWGQMKCPIVGVVKDFNAMALRKGLVPVLITSVKNYYATMGMKLQTNDVAGTLKKAELVWNDVYPEFVYDQKFLDTKIANFYTKETRLSSLYKLFAGLAIFLSCLGLYGLASFMAVQKTKEVGVRKVLGASVSSIVFLFSKEFLLLIGIAFLIATPLAWYFMYDWLQDFVYRINISWWILLIASLITMIVALVTISFKAIRSANANPIKSLRTE